MIFRSRWKFLLNFLLLTLVPMNSDWEICCKNTSNNSNNYLTSRSYPNYVLTQIWKLSKENNISSHLMQKDEAEWYICAENIRCFGSIRELDQEIGFVGIRKLVQSWTFMLVIMKIVKLLKCRSNLCFKKDPSCFSNCEWSWKVRRWNDRPHWRRRAESYKETFLLKQVLKWNPR